MNLVCRHQQSPEKNPGIRACTHHADAYHIGWGGIATHTELRLVRVWREEEYLYSPIAIQRLVCNL